MGLDLDPEKLRRRLPGKSPRAPDSHGQAERLPIGEM